MSSVRVRGEEVTDLELVCVGVAVGEDEERIEQEPEPGGDGAKGDDHARKSVDREDRARREAEDRSVDAREREQLRRIASAPTVPRVHCAGTHRRGNDVPLR